MPISLCPVILVISLKLCLGYLFYSLKEYCDYDKHSCWLAWDVLKDGFLKIIDTNDSYKANLNNVGAGGVVQDSHGS